MKVAFDENMPAALVRTFQTLAADKGFKRLFQGIEIVSAKDYTPKPTDRDYVARSDVPWLRRYRRAGGKIVISGNTKMVRVPQELQALIEEGFVTFFFPEAWNQWGFLRKSGMILVWLERVIAQGKLAKRGSLYRVPINWTDDAKLLVIKPPTPLKLPEMEEPQRPSSPRPQARRPAKKPPPGEPALLALMRSSSHQPMNATSQVDHSPDPLEKPQAEVAAGDNDTKRSLAADASLTESDFMARFLPVSGLFSAECGNGIRSRLVVVRAAH